MLSKLRTAEKLIGVKQSGKSIREGRAALVFIADDAAPRITDPIKNLCRETDTEIIMVSTMKELGDACGIEVGSAVAVLLK